MLKKKILVVGGAGYVGTAIINKLLSSKYEVTCVDNLVYKNIQSLKSFNYKKNFKFYKLDAGDLKIQKILPKVDFIIYLAGLVGDPITKKFPKASFIANEGIIKKFVKYCLKEKRKHTFIFVSTCSNYGLRSKNEKAKEDSKLNPLSLYAQSKVNIEKYLLNIKNKNFDPVILRFSTAFGLSSRMRFDLTVNEFVKDLFLYKEVKVYDENTWRPYCHVKDFARLMLYLLKKPISEISKEIYNVGSDNNNFTKKNISKAALKIVKKGKIIFVKGGNDPRNYKVNFSKLEKKLGFKTRYSVDYGIKEILKFLKDKKFNAKNFKLENYGNYKIF